MLAVAIAGLGAIEFGALDTLAARLFDAAGDGAAALQTYREALKN